MINDFEGTQRTASTEANTEPNEKVISTLNGLIQTCKDGQDGFKDAAEGVERSELKTTFYKFSQQRAEFVGVLQQLVRSLGGNPEDSGSFTGALHRGWMDIKSAVTGKDEEAILNECERGEDSAKEAYKDALEQALPANISDVLSQQSNAVLAAHNQIKHLRDSERHNAASPGA